MKEADILLGGFAQAHIGTLNEAAVAVFERLLDEGDNDLVNWILGREAPPERVRSAILDKLITDSKGS